MAVTVKKAVLWRRLLAATRSFPYATTVPCLIEMRGPNALSSLSGRRRAFTLACFAIWAGSPSWGALQVWAIVRGDRGMAHAGHGQNPPPNRAEAREAGGPPLAFLWNCYRHRT
jgi:hypothetical protein